MILAKRRGARHRRAITAVLATIILLALVQTILLGYFLLVVNGDFLGTQANQSRQNAIQVAAEEQVVVTPSLTSGSLGISVANTGSVPSTITAVYVKGLDGTFLSHSVAVPGSNYLVGAHDLNVTLPLTINPGQSTSQLSGCGGLHGCNIGINTAAFTYSGTSVVVGVITATGNTFTAQFPIPSSATTLTSLSTSDITSTFTTGSAVTTISTTTTVVSTTNSYTTVVCSNCVTTTTEGQGTPALTVSFLACPSAGCSSSNFVYNGGTITLTATVTNLSPQSATGVQLFVVPASGLTTGTATVSPSGACSPSSEVLAAGKSGLFQCSFTAYSGSTGGTVAFAGYAAGTVGTSYSTSASTTSNSVQIGNVVGTGGWSVAPFLFNFESDTPSAAGVASAGTPVSAEFVSAGNAYVAWYLDVKNTYNSSLTIIDTSFMITERLGPDPTWWIVDAACYPGQTGCGASPTLTPYSCYPGEAPSTPGYNCITVAQGATQQVIFATCAPANSGSAGYAIWAWQDTGGGGGCSQPYPSWSPPEGDAAVASIFYTLGSSTSGTVYSTVLPAQSVVFTYPSTLTVTCTPNPDAVGSASTCKGTVTSTGTPTGTLEFTVSPTTGTLSPASGVCTLSAGACSVTFNPSVGGSYTVAATYEGDSTHGPATGSTTLSTAVTIPILIATPAGGSAFVYTVSGCSVSPTSGTSGASATDFTATASCVLTVTMPTAGANTRYVFALSASSTTVTTCTTATCSTFQPSDYYQLHNTWQASTNGQGPPTWDSGLSIAPTGTVAGVGSTNVCTISPTSGSTTTATCAGWSDFDTAVTAPATASGAGTNIQWKLYGTTSQTPTTGGNTETAFTYYKQLQNTYRATPTSPATWDAVFSIPVTGTLGGTSGATGCSIATTSGGGAASLHDLF